MGHSWNCPDEYEARQQARRDAEFDHSYYGRDTYRSPYECDEANEAYRREYRASYEHEEEERAYERRLERQREEQRQEEEYWAQLAEEEARQRAEEEAYWSEQYAASVGRNPEGQDAGERLGAEHEHAVPSQTGDAHTLPPSPRNSHETD